ncbi:hypothetical protein SARC_07303 [Sphaeroforma arctica JP610]|uniref:Dynamin GTPase domain-containing protein n=1 Tax=Sphaeroforma arctica JP610 TaxID=667725 RepID=A0A0L0FWJ5_9EUKA|nr:hypothetical protein SARC_07303 [Sphaeroforma arctica JP610]KNC80328.1 hypothetical protein SARC_07303 [Sphaeroforma arctica JP610]|eukprot:XP_014154230.1 hypothetical protein SARC_07303 [Sphaeroforma arctica JP610]
MTTSFTELNKCDIRPLLQLNDQLRRFAVAETDVNVTSIVAVGDQSHGKASVFEALAGVELARGEGVQTRLPLELRLRSLGAKCERDECATIKNQDSPEKRILIDEIAAGVRNHPNTIAGESDVVDSVLELTVYRRDADDLTLIDLLGMTRVPVHGQSKDVEAVITRIYDRYM